MANHMKTKNKNGSHYISCFEGHILDRWQLEMSSCSTAVSLLKYTKTEISYRDVTKLHLHVLSSRPDKLCLQWKRFTLFLSTLDLLPLHRPPSSPVFCLIVVVRPLHSKESNEEHSKNDTHTHTHTNRALNTKNKKNKTYSNNFKKLRSTDFPK